MANDLKVALTGGSGFVASKIIDSPESNRYSWILLSRSDSKESNLVSSNARSIRRITTDYLDQDTLVESLIGVQVLVHTAAMVKPVGTRKEFTEANTFTTERLLTAAKAAGVMKVVFISSRSAIGSKPGVQDVNDNLPADQYGPRQHYGESKFQAENAVRASGLDYVIIRPTVITGIGDKNFLPGLVSRIRSKKFAFLGSEDHKMSFNIVDNLVDLVYTAIENPQMSGRTLLSTDSPAIRWRDLIKLVYDEIPDLPEYKIPTIPLGLAKPIGSMMDHTFLCMRALTGVQLNLPMSRSIVDYYGSNMTFNASALRELGFKPKVDVLTGLRQALRAVR